MSGKSCLFLWHVLNRDFPIRPCWDFTKPEIHVVNPFFEKLTCFRCCYQIVARCAKSKSNCCSRGKVYTTLLSFFVATKGTSGVGAKKFRIILN